MQNIKECKICHSKVSIKLKNFNVYTNSFKDFRGIIKDIKIKVGLKMCMKCGFIFYDNVPTLNELELIYKRENRNVVKKTKQRVYLLEKSLMFLKNNINIREVKKVIDIGAGDFSLLDKLSETYPSLNFSAINVSCPYKKHNKIRVYHQILEKFNNEEKYDFIILSHILEHIICFDDFFINLEKILHKNTKLYIEVPFQIGPNLLLSRSFHTQHINYFTLDSLCNLLKLKGYKLESYDFDKNGYFYYGIPGIIRTIFSKGLNGKDAEIRNYSINSLFYLFNPFIYVKNMLKKVLTNFSLILKTKINKVIWILKN